jgi:Zn-dependent peptidase ImmA (M78 family)/transcriptional regulator with XRE-family HTH domain
MSFDLQLFSKKLLKCRTNLQMTLKEVAAHLGVTVSRLKALEAGDALPTGDEILIFSDFYKQDYQFFISNEYKTAIEQVQILYRKHGANFSKEDRWVVQEFLYLCECEQLVYEACNIQHLTYTPRIAGTYFIGHGVDAAKDLRKALGLNTESLIKDAYGLFRKLGIHIFRRKLENSSISGLFIMHPKAGNCILVNYDEDIFRQNFTVAHEVAHAIFDAQESINVSYEKFDQTDLKEVRANSFASHFLIPQEELLKRSNFNWTKDIILNLAIQLKVNTQPLAIALRNAKLIDKEKAREVGSWKVPRSEKFDSELHGLSERRYRVKQQLLERGLSDHYLRVCHKAYETGKISAQRLSEMLLVREEELTPLLDLYNLALSYEN